MQHLFVVVYCLAHEINHHFKVHAHLLWRASSESIGDFSESWSKLLTSKQTTEWTLFTLNKAVQVKWVEDDIAWVKAEVFVIVIVVIVVDI